MNATPARLGKYELQELLGRGGMAEVWKALDIQLQRYVAIKLLSADLQDDPDFVSRFTHEAQVIAGLRHPNIVQIYDFHIGDDTITGSSALESTAYMVMEYVQGETLADYIHRTSHKQQIPPAADIVRLFTPIGLAIDYAHQRGMIHRDIKPANILLDQKRTARNPMGEPILSDFGLAKLVSGVSQTTTGVLMGTPIYISPEQVLNRPLSPQTDLYALGAVLYEIFTGMPPFTGESVTGIMMQRITGIPREPHLVNPNLPPALSTVLLKSLSSNPQDRYPSASAMIAAVAEAFNIPVPEDLKLAVYSSTDAIKPPMDLILPSKPLPDVKLVSPEMVAVDTPEVAGVVAHPIPSSAETKYGMHQLAATMLPLALGPELPQLPTSSPSQKHPRLRFVLAALLICMLAGSGLSALFLLNGHGLTFAASSDAIVGQAFFASSGKINATTNSGNNDEFQIDLHNIPEPQSGTSYYAWLLPDKSQTEAAPILLGKLPVDNGSVHFLYTGDSRHSNLLATTSRFLITEEASNLTPEVPSPDLSEWRYYAEIPQTPTPGQTYSLLDHLRHLLASDPTLEAYHLPGGLDIWTYRNTQKVMQLALSAQNDWNTKDYTSLHQQIVGILDYLDGTNYVWQDVPANTPIVANPTYSRIGLLELVPGQENPPGYLSHIELHLNGVVSSPGATQYQHILAGQIDTEITTMQGWLQQVRRDAAQLARMNDTQLALPSSLTLINDVTTQATYAFTGKDASTGKMEKGFSQIYVDMQHMATFEVMAYK
jgi:eukaryotic-like serine/threonine-protein kinase